MQQVKSFCARVGRTEKHSFPTAIDNVDECLKYFLQDLEFDYVIFSVTDKVHSVGSEIFLIRVIIYGPKPDSPQK